MNYQIQSWPGRTVAGFHMVGPWETTVCQGFDQLALWVKSNNIHSGEWLAVYYDNPEITPPEKLRCDTVISVPEDFVIPDNSEGVILTQIEGGLYAVAHARVDDNNFAAPWMDFFSALMQDEKYTFSPKPTFDHYLNDGSESGVWEFDMYIAVQEKA
ncbi:DNA gyrase inhibitor SbmC [Entomohabitans teleogrylli]|uniref:DNA gyrase inhibitor SbmC n=1 Tax=Entomohabitans teleogrylli TaxID=1384589 RepID=UPI00073D79B1|nr:DNA gyrase inhibitor SbmC [Entomohabitans teleogrylli]